MITGQEVWESLVEDPAMQGQEYLYPVLEPMVKEIPNLLADDLQKPVSVETLIRGRLKFVKYCLDHSFVQNAVDAMPDEAFGFFDKDDMAGMMEETLKSLVEMSEEILEDVTDFLEQHGVTDEQVVLAPKTGLDAAMRKRYKQGGMTMEDLLRGQPGVIILDKK